MLELRGRGVLVGCVVDPVEAADILDMDAGPGSWITGRCGRFARRARLGRGPGQGADHEAGADPLHVLSAGMTNVRARPPGYGLGSEAVQAAGGDAGGGL
jgi:hypothetical protein